MQAGKREDNVIRAIPACLRSGERRVSFRKEALRQRYMKKGQILEGVIDRVEYPGKGILRTEDREIAVKNVLPGQTVRISVTKAKRYKTEGRLLEVLKPCEKQIPSDCPHFGECGGCSYRELSYEDQAAMKEEQVRALLEKACPDSHYEGIHKSPVIDGYRNKMEFTFGDSCKGGPLCLGMHRRGSFYDVVTVDECRIIDNDFRSILKCTLAVASKSGLPYFHRGTHQGYLRHLLVRKAARTGDILVDLVTTRQADQEQEQALEQALTDRLLALPLQGKIAGILHTYNDRIADVIENEGTNILWGRSMIFEELLGLRFGITPFSFFQTNSVGAEKLYSIVRDYIGTTKDKVIFDLYSGTGTIAQILAPVAKHVTGVEIVEEAVEAARQNAAANGLDNCTFIAGDVLKVVQELTEKPDLIVLDPPREGIHPKALGHIIDFGVERIVYVSCKATSLVRDLELLQGRGYRVERSCTVDMFPGTVHVETVVLLSREQK